MSGNTIPPPAGLGDRGRQFWQSILGDLDLEAGELALLSETCRCLDRLGDIDAALLDSSLLTADGRINPLLVEARLQGVTLARLIASLRLPDEYRAELLDRGQRRGAARGTYHLREVKRA